MVCDCSWNNPFSIDVYINVMASADYLEVMKEFLERTMRRVVKEITNRLEEGVKNLFTGEKYLRYLQTMSSSSSNIICLF